MSQLKKMNPPQQKHIIGETLNKGGGGVEKQGQRIRVTASSKGQKRHSTLL